MYVLAASSTGIAGAAPSTLALTRLARSFRLALAAPLTISLADSATLPDTAEWLDTMLTTVLTKSATGPSLLAPLDLGPTTSSSATKPSRRM